MIGDRLKDQNGFTILEVLIAVTILAIGFMGYMMLLTTSIGSRSFAAEMNRATLVGSGFLDEILLADFSSNDLQAGQHQTAKSMGNRVVTINWTVYDNCPTSLTKLVQITAQWTENNKTKTLGVTQVRGRW